MRYAEYLRKSRADDPSEPIEVTLARHREALRQCMAKHALVVAPEDVFEEVASGDSLYARPQMLKLLEAVEQGVYDGVFCMDIQRLGRGSMSDQGAILDAFKLSGTKIITPSKVYDLSDENDETYTEFETFLGRQEYKMIKRRLRRGIKATVESGGYIANAPYGYDKTRIGKTPSLKPNPEEAPFVRMIFDLYLSGMGCQRIADRINSLGAKPRRDVQFNRTTIRNILQNPVYTGKIVWDRKTHIRPSRQSGGKHLTIYNPQESWTIVDGLHQSIVTQETFEQVQGIFAKRHRSPSFTGVIENPLAGLIVCGNCGHHMQRQADKRGGPMLLCQKRGCIVSSKLHLVEEVLISRLREEMNELVKNAGSESPGEDNTAQTLKAIERQIATAKAQDSRLYDLVEQGVYDTETFLQRHAALSQRIADLEQARADIRPRERLDVPKMAERIQDVLDSYFDMDPQQRNELLKSVLEKVIYKKEPGAKPAEFHLTLFLLPVYL